MLMPRLIPVLLLMNGQLVRSERFTTHQIIGDPLHEVARFNEWKVDELIYLDISRTAGLAQGRRDAGNRAYADAMEVLEAVASHCFMPLTWGGHVTSLDQVRDIFKRGADKVAINTAAYETPELITQVSKRFGAQAMVVSIDARQTENGYEVMTQGGRTGTGRDPVSWAKEAEDRGAGEILLQSLDRDGGGTGYDTTLIEQVSQAVTIPVIACSGVGVYEHYAKGLKAGADAVAAANIWHFKELADRGGKRALQRAGFDVRM
jgi:cyclase